MAKRKGVNPQIIYAIKISLQNYFTGQGTKAKSYSITNWLQKVVMQRYKVEKHDWKENKIRVSKRLEAADVDK